MTDITDDVREFLLALADDKHLMGQQHAEWIGIAPFLEEDLAFCSIGQDELGHAAQLYALLSNDDDVSIDALAYGRSAHEYRSAWVCELATPTWADAFVRHFMFDCADQLRWALLTDSSLPALRGIAAIVEREEVYHRRHADAMLDVLLADSEAAGRLSDAAQRLAPLMLGLFEPVAGEATAVAQGVAAAPFQSQQQAFIDAVQARLPTVTWQTAPAQNARTVRSDAWQPLMSRMREVFDLDPSATW